MLVVEDELLLDELVVHLQLINLWLVVDDALLVLPQVSQLVLQGAVHLDGNAANFLHKTAGGVRHTDNEHKRTIRSRNVL